MKTEVGVYSSLLNPSLITILFIRIYQTIQEQPRINMHKFQTETGTCTIAKRTESI